MELGDGRGGQLEVGDAPYIVMGKIQPLSNKFSPRHTVLPLQGRGTTVRLCGTSVANHSTTATATQAGTSLIRGQYYRLRGTTAPTCGTTARQESHGLGRTRMK